MFSGIIERVGRVLSVRDHGDGRRLVLDAPGYWDPLSPGSSVAVDGECLTLVSRDGDSAGFDVVPETLSCTTLGRRVAGDGVNLERSIAAGARLDGHFVQGHVDAVATVAAVERGPAGQRWRFALESATMRYIVPKGSVAVDGISLTVTEVRNGQFGVALVPHTLEHTTLGGKRPGDHVNIETDILARTVIHAIESLSAGARGGPTLDPFRAPGSADA